MQNLGLTANVSHGTNSVISSTDCDWSHLRQGYLLRIGNDLCDYQIANVEEFKYSKDFEVVNEQILKVKENINLFLAVGDEIDISFIEYEVYTVFSISQAGTGYKVGDILVVPGGVAVQDSYLGSRQFASLVVKNINSVGGIEKVEIDNKGRYTTSPKEGFINMGGGSGCNAILDVRFKLSDERKHCERTVESVNFSNNETLIKISYSLPGDIKFGKLSVSKQKITLTSNYAGESKNNVEIKVMKDITSYLKLPLAAQNTNQISEVFNSAMRILDNKIQEIERKLDV